MRILMMLVLLVVSGSAWADALKVTVKAKKDSSDQRHFDHRHNGHDSCPEWALAAPLLESVLL